MKFLVDAQLPRRLSEWLTAHGHDAVHTLDLPDGNRTSDADINTITHVESRILITKDEDFVNSFLTSQDPYKLLHVATGNISNQQLLDLFAKNMPQLERAIVADAYIELARDAIIVH